MESLLVTLNSLSPGDTCIVHKINSDTAIVQRLFDLGISEGVLIEVLYKSPSGNPVAYHVRGVVIALRDDVTNKILVQEVTGDYEPF